MPADFSIVLGEEYQDVAATPRDIKFWMPENAVIQRANAILQLMVYPRLDPDDLKVEVSINGTTVLTYGPIQLILCARSTSFSTQPICIMAITS